MSDSYIPTPPSEWSDEQKNEYIARKKWMEEFNKSHASERASKKAKEDEELHKLIEGNWGDSLIRGHKIINGQNEIEKRREEGTNIVVVYQEAKRLPSGQLDPDSIDPKVVKAVYATRMGLKSEAGSKFVGVSEVEFNAITFRDDYIEIIRNNIEVLPPLQELDARLYHLATTAPKASTRLSSIDRLYKRRGVDVHNPKPVAPVTNNNIINVLNNFKKGGGVISREGGERERGSGGGDPPPTQIPPTNDILQIDGEVVDSGDISHQEGDNNVQ